MRAEGGPGATAPLDPDGREVDERRAVCVGRGVGPVDGEFRRMGWGDKAQREQ
jgi:hypothetical protein